MGFFIELFIIFVNTGTLQYHRHYLPGVSPSVTTDENIKDIQYYFKENLNASTQTAAQVNYKTFFKPASI